MILGVFFQLSFLLNYMLVVNFHLKVKERRKQSMESKLTCPPIATSALSSTLFRHSSNSLQYVAALLSNL